MVYSFICKKKSFYENLLQIFRYQKRIKKKTIREILILSLETFQWAFNGAETQGGNGGKCPQKKINTGRKRQKPQQNHRREGQNGLNTRGRREEGKVRRDTRRRS